MSLTATAAAPTETVGDLWQVDTAELDRLIAEMEQEATTYLEAFHAEWERTGRQALEEALAALEADLAGWEGV